MRGIDELELRIYTYPELCALFGQNRMAGDSKVAQLREWACYFRWSNPTKQKFLIEEIYRTPLEKEDGRRNNGGNITSKYLCLDDIAMECFAEDKEVVGTLADILVQIGVLTEKYRECRFKKHGLVQSGIPTYVVDNVMWNIHTCVFNAFKSSLERLSNDGYIDLRVNLVLILQDRHEKVLDKSTSDSIVEIENEQLKEMGLTRRDLFIEKNYTEYSKGVKGKINDIYGWDVLYYFKRYQVNVTDKVYSRKTSEGYDALTRRFVKTICYAMLRIDIPKDKEDESKNSYNYTQDDLIMHTRELIDLFFVSMHTISWEKYWDDNELDFDANTRDIVFWTNFCLMKDIDSWFENQEERSKNEAYEIEKNHYREQALEELVDYDIEEFMDVIPEIDWKRVFEDAEYAERCGEACCIYNEIGDSFMYYGKQEVVNGYRRYCARAIYNGIPKFELLPLADFERDYNT